MSESTYQTIAVTLYFVAMLGIGWFAYSRTRDNLDDYMLAGRGLKPWVAALSAGASDMSGWLLMGLPGAIYAKGLIEAWIAIGLTIGAWLNWKFVAPRLRSYTEVAGNSITIPSFLEHRLRDSSRSLRLVCGVIILVFFTFYVSSGMVAAGKFFDSTFGVSYVHGMLIVAVVTMVYTLFGGFLGATLTDVAQGLLMLAALIAVPVAALIQVGGVGTTVDTVESVNPNFFSLVAGGSVLGVISAAAWGLGYFGQPHIIVRFMALRSPQEATTARRFGIGWMVASAGGAIATAVVGLAYFTINPERAPKDPETVFLLLSQILFHPFVAGLVLAAVLAAIMSTVSSQLVVCSSALVEDLFKIFAEKTGRAVGITDSTYVRLGRLGVLLVAVVAVVLAIDPAQSILDLVGFAWSGFGASFGPVVLLALFWRRLTHQGALAGLVTGAVVVFLWGEFKPIDLFEIVPGFIANLVVAVGVSLATYRTDEIIDDEFDRAARLAEKAPA
ncbi:sodium/proline symporter PutP [Tsukamurella strandjordii]|uniref:sodium/proline symporter PutP n=1 Tax=Tsukamurella TaxID=2060 RepID=UPI001C7D4195|nr:sodium/proline symporter PutP [Tsukamurella sp. TY48]GIZ99569.1 sodium:proline symporter [Tsukamurella sp. TY48]